jgi:large subunit ribosomal protein L33
MAKSKGTRLVITLGCTECRKNEMKRSSGVSRYSTKKNRKNTTMKKKRSEYLNVFELTFQTK